jgi:hypothetical protein
MYALFGKVTPYIKAKPRGEVPRPDNLVFKLHYKVNKTDLKADSGRL